MSRTKGKPKTGGRKAGTPNKITGTLKEFLANLIDQNRVQIECDLKSLQPKDRLIILERLMQYVTPKRCEGLPIVPPKGLKIEIVEPDKWVCDFPDTENDVSL